MQQWLIQAKRFIHTTRLAWQALSRREQWSVGSLIVLVGVLGVYLGLIAPALTAIEQARAQLPVLRIQSATVSDIINQANALRKKAVATDTSVASQTDIQNSLIRYGLQQEQWTLSQSEAVTNSAEVAWQVSLHDVTSDALLAWLANVPAELRLHAKTIDLERLTNASGRPVPGRVRGSVLLTTAPLNKE